MKTAREELEEYLLSSQLFWQLSGILKKENTLTPGNLLLIKRKIEGRNQDAGAVLEFYRDWAQIERILSDWRAHWDQKAALEFDSRLKTWGNYLAEFQEDRGVKSAQFRNEVKNRAIMQLLLENAGRKIEVPGKELLLTLDSQLKIYSVIGDFVWEGGLERVFPKDDFWFLYISFEKR